jgi:hypothetical protein
MKFQTQSWKYTIRRKGRGDREREREREETILKYMKDGVV